MEIIALNEELERQAREHQAAAAAAAAALAAAAAAAAIPPGQDHLEQLAPEVLQTPPHPQEEVLQPPPKPIKTPPRARLAATQQQRLQQATALVNVTLAEVQPTAPSVVSSKAGSPNTSVTSSSSASSEASAFLTPQQDAPCKRLPPKTADRGFFKSIQNTLAAGLGSLASDFNAAGPSKSESHHHQNFNLCKFQIVQVTQQLS